MTHQAKKEFYLKQGKIAAKNNAMIAPKMKNYDMGIEIQNTDTRSTYEKLNDDTLLNNQLRGEVYSIFNNDSQQSDNFLNLMKYDNITYNDFITVSDDLKQRFKGKLALAPAVFSIMKKLINNVNNTGTSTATGQQNNTAAFEALKEYVEDLYNNNIINKKDGNEATDLLIAAEEVLKLTFDDVYNKSMENNSLINRKSLIGPIKELMEINVLMDDDINKPELLLNKLKDIKEIIEDEVNKTLNQKQKKGNKNVEVVEEKLKKAENFSKLTDIQKLLDDLTEPKLRKIVELFGIKKTSKTSVQQLKDKIDTFFIDTQKDKIITIARTKGIAGSQRRIILKNAINSIL
jgi:hypothetical protein